MLYHETNAQLNKTIYVIYVFKLETLTGGLNSTIHWNCYYLTSARRWIGYQRVQGWIST